MSFCRVFAFDCLSRLFTKRIWRLSFGRDHSLNAFYGFEKACYKTVASRIAPQGCK